ncbi:uncharacterized protein LOC141856729 [Brevipalpus obovatus]|uniref:uncharacterized protein LOC141856729 n=1 Tax=Brevipalpus obovatus TaxID=246614 RepID=UPI003D9F3F8C
MKSNNKKGPMARRVKLEPVSELADDDKMSSLKTNSIISRDDNSVNISLACKSKPIGQCKSSCDVDNFPVIQRTIKLEKRDESSGEEMSMESATLCTPRDPSHRLSPTMDIRPVPMNATGTPIPYPIGAIRHISGCVNSRDFTIISPNGHNHLHNRSKLCKRVTIGSGPVRTTKKPSRRVFTNCRERERQQNVNDAFQELRSKIPTEPLDKKLSKCSILTRAIDYIKLLKSVLDFFDRNLYPPKFDETHELNGVYSHDMISVTNGTRSPTDSSVENESISKPKPRRSICEPDDCHRHRVKRLRSDSNGKQMDTENSTDIELESSIELSSPSTMSSPSDTD